MKNNNIIIGLLLLVQFGIVSCSKFELASSTPKLFSNVFIENFSMDDYKILYNGDSTVLRDMTSLIPKGKAKFTLINRNTNTQYETELDIKYPTDTLEITNLRPKKDPGQLAKKGAFAASLLAERRPGYIRIKIMGASVDSFMKTNNITAMNLVFKQQLTNMRPIILHPVGDTINIPAGMGPDKYIDLKKIDWSKLERKENWTGKVKYKVEAFTTTGKRLMMGSKPPFNRLPATISLDTNYWMDDKGNYQGNSVYIIEMTEITRVLGGQTIYLLSLKELFSF